LSQVSTKRQLSLRWSVGAKKRVKVTNFSRNKISENECLCFVALGITLNDFDARTFLICELFVEGGERDFDVAIKASKLGPARLECL
jgi:hypothetical protein